MRSNAMTGSRICSISLIVFSLVTAPTQAIWFRTSSVEWQIDLADMVIIGVAQATKSMEPLNKHWDSQLVNCKVVEVVKGEWTDPILFRQDYRSSKRSLKWSAHRIEQGERILLFLNQNSTRSSPEVDNWCNLSNPIKEVGPSEHAAYNNGCKLLTDESSILALVRKRTRDNPMPKRGLIVPFQPLGGSRHDFVVTAEPEFEQQFIDLLQSEYYGDRCDAIFNLVSYPSDKTRRLIRPFLHDPATATVGNYNHEGRDVTYYPVRQAAYVALALLGDDPPLPKPYFDKIMPSMFETAFENEVYFPRGNWRRLKDIVDLPPEFPFEFLRGKKPVQQSHDWRFLKYSYAFKSNFAEIRDAVEKELLMKAFKISEDEPHGFGREWRSVKYIRGNEQVIIFQNMRYTVPQSGNSPHSVIGVDLEGWVSFRVQLEQTIGGPATSSESGDGR